MAELFILVQYSILNFKKSLAAKNEVEMKYHSWSGLKRHSANLFFWPHIVWKKEELAG